MGERKRIEAEGRSTDFSFDDGATKSNPAPKCGAQGQTETKPKCRCADLTNCNFIIDEAAFPGGGPQFPGHCFLEFIQNPADPKTDCYDDVEWSASNGRFWSRKACGDAVKDIPKPEVVFNPGGVNNNEEKPKGESAEIQSGVIFSD